MTKSAMVINDLSSFGSCSLTAYIAVLSAMNIKPCPLPTAVLSAQSEFPRYYCRDLTDIMAPYRKAWEENRESFDAICTGYFSNSAQLDEAERIIDAFRGGSCTVIVDPVMGDNGSLYPAYDRDSCEKMKALAQKADVLTPNLTELCILTDTPYSEFSGRGEEELINRVTACASRFAASRDVIVTGLRTGDKILNLVFSKGIVSRVYSKRCGESFSGTGDIFTAIICGSLLNGKALTTAAEAAAAFLEAAAADTVKEAHDPVYGVNFEKFLKRLGD